MQFQRSQLASMEQILLLQVDCLENALGYYDAACGSKSNKSTIYEVIGNVKVLVEVMSENARERITQSQSQMNSNINSQNNNTYSKNPSKGLYSSFETADNNVYRKGIKKVPPAFQRINRKNLKIKSANKYHIDTTSLLQNIPDETIYGPQNNMNSNGAQRYHSSNNNNNTYNVTKNGREVDASMLAIDIPENDLTELKRIIDLARTTREQNENNNQQAAEGSKSKASLGTPTTNTSYGPDIITDEMLETLPSWASPPSDKKGGNEATYTDTGNSNVNTKSKSNGSDTRSSDQRGLQKSTTDEKLLTVLHSKNKVLTDSLEIHDKQEVHHEKHEIDYSPREADPSEIHHYHKQDDHYIYHKEDMVEDDEDAYDIIDHIYSAGNGEALELKDDINPAEILWISSSDLTSSPRERDPKTRRPPPPINANAGMSLEFVNSEGGSAYEALPSGSTPR